MLITGIVGRDDRNSTVNLVNSILASSGKKVSTIETIGLRGLDSKRIKSYLNELELNGVDFLILKINPQDTLSDVFSRALLDIMIFTNKSENVKERDVQAYENQVRKAFSLLKENGIAIVNADDDELTCFFQDVKQHIITYGFNSKANVTTSSVGEMLFKDNFICCLQKALPAKNGMLIEPQEYSIKVESEKVDAYCVLAAASFAIVNGVDLNHLEG